MRILNFKMSDKSRNFPTSGRNTGKAVHLLWNIRFEADGYGLCDMED